MELSYTVRIQRCARALMTAALLVAIVHTASPAIAANYSVLHTFTGGASNGQQANAGLAVIGDTLYGTDQVWRA